MFVLKSSPLKWNARPKNAFCSNETPFLAPHFLRRRWPTSSLLGTDALFSETPFSLIANTWSLIRVYSVWKVFCACPEAFMWLWALKIVFLPSSQLAPIPPTPETGPPWSVWWWWWKCALHESVLSRGSALVPHVDNFQLSSKNRFRIVGSELFCDYHCWHLVGSLLISD